MSINNQVRLPSYGDVEAVKMAIRLSNAPVLICEGVTDKNNAIRYLDAATDLLIIVSDQIQGAGSSREKVEDSIAESIDGVAAVVDSDVCIDSILGFQDQRISQDNVFYSDGYTLENYILIYWCDLQRYFDPSNTCWSNTLDKIDEYLKAISIWSVFARHVCMREYGSMGYSKERVCKQLMQSSIQDLLNVVHDNIQVNNVISYLTGISEQDYIRCVNLARESVKSVGRVEHRYLVDKWFVPYLIKQLLASSDIRGYDSRRGDELCDTCLSHLMRDKKTLHLSRAFEWLGL